MNRRPIPPAIATALSLLIIALSVSLWLRNGDSLPSERGKSTTPHPTPQTVATPRSDPQTENGTSESDEHPENASHAIPDERILTFASEASYRHFLASDHRSLTILAQNDRLRSIRARVAKTFDPQTLPPDAQSNANYTLLTPLPIPTSAIAADKAFGNAALSFVNGLLPNGSAGKGIKVAILDTGIRNHTTLNPDKIERYGTSTPQDYLSHGTAVASLIAGQDGSGIAPQAELLGFQVLDKDGIGDAFSLADAIIQAVDAGSNIINMSVGTYGSNQALANAVAYANANGVVLVASAGNESVTALPYPAAYESVIAVSAIDSEGHPTSFSNQSSAVDIAAPGVGVYAAWEDDQWVNFSGTSASAPYVSGAIAALSSELDIPATEAADLLLANANDSGLPGVDPQLGRGYIDLQRSLNSNTSYTDLALADIYLVPEKDENGQYPIYLSAQNRGTNRIPAATLDYTLPNGITQTVYLGALDPGQTANTVLTASSNSLSSGYQISASVRTDTYATDANSTNDSRRAQLDIPTEEAAP